MKKYLMTFLILLSSTLCLSAGVLAVDGFGQNDSIINKDIDKAIGETALKKCMNEFNDPIRCGIYHGVNNPENESLPEVQGIISEEEIRTHGDALTETIRLIQRIINRSLGMLGLIALVYLIYSGFLMQTAAGDDKQYSKGKSGIKTAVIAIAGIGISRFVVSMILWIIQQLTANVSK